MGGSGGGGSSGAINFPSYMKEIHHNWLTSSGSAGFITDGGTPMTNSVVQMMNAAQSSGKVTLTNSPYNGLTGYNPDRLYMDSGDDYSTYQGQSPFKLLQLFLAETPESLYTTYSTDAVATALIDAYAVELDEQYNNTLVPAIANEYAGINATGSSAFSISMAGVAKQKIREVSNFIGALKIGLATQRVQMKMDWRRLLSGISMENSKAYLISKKEETMITTEYTVDNALWDLEVYQYGTQVMASIAGTGTAGDDGGASKGMRFMKDTLIRPMSNARTGEGAGSIVLGTLGYYNANYYQSDRFK